MANYQFHPTLVLRSPIYSYEAYTDADLYEFLKTDYFKKAIYFSSEVFYNELLKKDFDLKKLDNRAIATIRKYFNRMCFRPTPFALYAGVGTVRWNEGKSDIRFNEKDIETNIQFSYAKSQEYAQKLILHNSDKLIYKPNATFYKIGNEYRFIKQGICGTQVDFFIDTLKSDRFFEQLLNYLNQGKTLSEIIACIIDKASCSINEANTYVRWLIDNQVINHQLETNITGEDYLKRIIDNDLSNCDCEDIQTSFNRLRNLHAINQLAEVPACVNNTSKEIKSSDFYVNLKINFPDGKLNAAYQQTILDGLYCLEKLSPFNASLAALADFIQKFNGKFDRQSVPLLLALDPELGVGYNDLASAGDDTNIAKNIVGGVDKNNKAALNWGDAHIMLFKKWQLKPIGQHAIILTEEDFSSVKSTDYNPPSTISVMFRVLGDKLLIESAGGNTATALIGRFTPLTPDIHHLAQDMANNEIENNPDIIFAEIAHVCNSHTANIDRRLNIYPYEIPILVQSTLPIENQLPLNDLFISVINGNIILQSQKNGKRVIPRLSSAFNYTRNDLAVFRFLCDLQSAEIKPTLSFNLNQFFPGLDFYPRVQYKNTILQLACWNLENTVFDSVFKQHKDGIQKAFSTIRQQLNLPTYIALTQSDNQLIFNLDNAEEIDFFLNTIKTLTRFKLTEFLFPATDNPIVLNSNKQPHINQFVASLFHHQIVYKPINAHAVSKLKIKRKCPPGSEWLYLKIYCHPVRSNELLSGAILKTVNNLLINKDISEWFYIRYIDPDYHIRLRVKTMLYHHQDVLFTIQKALSKYTDQGIISNIMIDAYEREIERYGHDLIEESEKVFYASSNFVALFLNKKQLPEASDNLWFAVASVNDILVLSGLHGSSLANFLERIFQSFLNEFRMIDNIKYKLDTEYRKQKNMVEDAATHGSEYYKALKLNKAYLLFVTTYQRAIKKIDPSKKQQKERWVSDMIHMHLNRLFANEPRKQEMTIYYFLLKYQTSKLAREAKSTK